MFIRLYFNRIISNILIITEMTIMLFIINSLILGLSALYYEHNWYTGTEDVYILSLDDRYESCEEKKRVIEELKKINGISEIGYSAKGTITYENSAYISIYYSPALYKMENRVSVGSWFNDKDENQVILCGSKLSAGKKSDDSIVINNNAATVEGIIYSYPYVMEFNMKEGIETLDLSTLSVKAQDYILINNFDLFDPDSYIIYGDNIALFTENNFEKDEVETYGELNPITKYIHSSKERYRIENKIAFLTGVLTAVIMVSAIEGIKRILIKENSNQTAVLKYCGLSWSRFIKIISGHNLINITISLLVTGFVLYENESPTFFILGSSLNYVSILPTILIIATTFLFNIVAAKRQYEKTD